MDRRALVAGTVTFLLLWSPTAHAQAEKTLNGCAKGTAKETKKYIADYLKTVGGCMDQISAAVIQNGGSATDAAAKCAKNLRKLVNGVDTTKTLSAKLATKIGKSCDPTVNPKLLHSEADILGTGALSEQIDAQNLDSFCELFGLSGPIDGLDKWVTCLTNAATCEARQSLATQYPRLLEWLTAVRPAIDALDSSSPTPDPAIVDALAALDALQSAIDSNNDTVADIACGSPLVCPPGQERSGGICVDCTAGSSNSDGLGPCEPCPAGTFSGAGAATCTPCPPGNYASSAGSVSCTPCDVGTSQPASGQSSCDNCPAGTYGNATGASSCTDCLAGTFSGSAGSTTCTDCGTGKFQAAPGQISCDPCPKGTANNTTGAIMCTPCNPGFVTPSVGSLNCSPCFAGQYEDATAGIACNPCPVGTFSTTSGASTCTDCPAGKFASLTGSTTCINCGTNTYNPATGQGACFPCSGAPAGSTSCSCTFP